MANYYCRKCGAMNASSINPPNFCNKCGNSFSNQAQSNGQSFGSFSDSRAIDYNFGGDSSGDDDEYIDLNSLRTDALFAAKIERTKEDEIKSNGTQIQDISFISSKEELKRSKQLKEKMRAMTTRQTNEDPMDKYRRLASSIKGDKPNRNSLFRGNKVEISESVLEEVSASRKVKKPVPKKSTTRKPSPEKSKTKVKSKKGGMKKNK